MNKPVGLYIHIPFCTAKCHYCDFAVFVGQDKFVDRYLSALDKEAERYAGRTLKTIFIGGGTPTTLSPLQIEHLFQSLRRHFNFSSLGEVTVEANPESATDEVLSAYKNAGVNRISFGLQTHDDALLSSLGRLHTYDVFLSAFTRARTLGFNNLNVDLIYGLPGQTILSWRETLQRVSDLSPEHVSAYALKIEAGTRLAKIMDSVDDDLESDMYLEASDQLRAAGYNHYEISNFAKPQRESAHNLMYWKNDDTIGLGVSAASHVGGRRYKNTARLNEYMSSIEQGAEPLVEDQHLESDQQAKESVMLALRLNEGVQENQARALAGDICDQFLAGGLASVEKGMYRLNPKGWLLSNQLFQHLV